MLGVVDDRELNIAFNRDENCFPFHFRTIESDFSFRTILSEGEIDLVRKRH